MVQHELWKYDLTYGSKFCPRRLKSINNVFESFLFGAGRRNQRILTRFWKSNSVYPSICRIFVHLFFFERARREKVTIKLCVCVLVNFTYMYLWNNGRLWSALRLFIPSWVGMSHAFYRPILAQNFFIFRSGGSKMIRNLRRSWWKIFPHLNTWLLKYDRCVSIGHWFSNWAISSLKWAIRPRREFGRQNQPRENTSTHSSYAPVH